MSRAAARHMQLHARRIDLPADDGTRISATAEPPAHMHALLSACGWSGSGQ
jgi:hypothetical protein